MLSSVRGESEITSSRVCHISESRSIRAENVDASPSGRRRCCWKAPVTDLAAAITVIDDSVFRHMVEEIPHIIWMTTPDGVVEYVNRQGRVYAGPPVGVSRVDWMSLVHADDVEKVTQAREMADRTRTPYRAECRIRRFDGEYRWHDLSGIPIHDELAAGVNTLNGAVTNAAVAEALGAQPVTIADAR